ncbi:protein PET117 homolog, mitochondrial [Drosophila pseudoobscura]|uniref:Protein PET117 homolog, mitochondrial n=1 Tax=Drosophila pseudoobscura pseudoobscura TaxID=46245 RepID=A0A6I8ULU8_DROPS|nr:protein PET117 homolog, mitochondrial [Drosophila pseudoobscura]
MSLTSRVTLGVAVTVSSAIIGYVHYKQSEDRLKLHEGVIRDVEQQQRRKHENRYTLQQQIDMTKQLKALEASSASPEPQAQSSPAESQPAQVEKQPKSPASNLKAHPAAQEVPPSQPTD